MTAKRERRAERLQAEDAAQTAIAKATPRSVSDDISYRGAGTLLLRVARLPSFAEALCFEVRAHGDPTGPDLTAQFRPSLYVSRGTKQGSRLVVGHDLVHAPADDLTRAVTRLDGITVPANAMPAAYAVADGSCVHLTIRCEFGTLQLDWVEDHAPRGWDPIDSFAREVFAQFQTYGEAG